MSGRPEAPRGRAASGDALDDLLDELVSRPASPGLNGAIPTGFSALDHALGGGLRKGTLTVLAGVPGAGTSMLALGVATRAAVKHYIPTLFMAPDTDTREVLLRALSATAVVSLSHLRFGGLTDQEVHRLDSVRAQLELAQFIVSAEWLTVSEQPLAENLVDYCRGIPLGLVVVDQTPDSRQEIRALKVAAQRHNLAVVVIAKARLHSAVGESRPLALVDLRMANDLAEYADLVLGLHRFDAHNPVTKRPGEARIEFLKHRSGPVVPLPGLLFQGHYARFVETTEGSQNL